MGCEVYANGDEIACKAGDNKVIAAMPDVCLSPPSPPAGPVPVPYPNTSFSKDMQNGSKTVMIKDQEVMLKDQSFYKTSPLGDEAATNGLGAGVVTHVITGKTYCVAWSMDVQFEGQNVDRHTDMTTGNHASPMLNRGPTGPTVAGGAGGGGTPPTCECCGGPLHAAPHMSAPMSADEWYKPNYPSCPPNKAEADAMKLYDEIKAGAKADGCGYLINEDKNDKCGKHYVVKKAERGEFDSMMSPMTRKQAPGYFIKQYGKSLAKKIMKRGARLTEKLKSKKAVSIAHVTPLAAGGCPVGGGNLKPVEEKCATYEKLLGDPVQNEIKKYHIRALGL